MGANNMSPDQTAPKEQSDLVPYCLQYRQIKGADDKSQNWHTKG